MTGLTIFEKFNNVELFTLEQYFDISSFIAHRSTYEIFYNFDVSSDYQSYTIWIKSCLVGKMADMQIFIGTQFLKNDEELIFTEGPFEIDQLNTPLIPLNFFRDFADDFLKITNKVTLVTEKNEESIFRKYLNLDFFQVERTKEYNYYIYTVKGENRKYSMSISTDSKSDLNKTVTFGYEENGKTHNCFVSISLLRELAIFFDSDICNKKN